jgi:peptidyl-tRNA hydrolase
MQYQPNDKLYIITRSDLSLGSQAVQGMHALQEFAIEHAEINKAWHNQSNYLCFLSVPDKESLLELIETCKREKIKCSIFMESDLNNEITAIALEPGIKAKKVCRNLPLALK